MSANTEILIKRSLANSAPSSLKQGELAYSYTSNTLFIGTSDGTSALPIGSFNDFSAHYQYGANTYGDQTHIPVITVSANGLITNVSTTEISTALAINADTGGPSEVNLLDQTLDIAGGDGINTSVSGQTISVFTDYTQVIGANGYGGSTQTIDGVLNISGDLNVTGNISYTDVATIVAQNSLIFLANNNIVSDVIDIGFVGQWGLPVGSFSYDTTTHSNYSELGLMWDGSQVVINRAYWTDTAALDTLLAMPAGTVYAMTPSGFGTKDFTTTSIWNDLGGGFYGATGTGSLTTDIPPSYTILDVSFTSAGGIKYTGLFRHAGDSGKDYYLFDNYTTNPDGSFVITPGSNNFTVSTLHANLKGDVDASTVKSGGFLAAEGTPDGGLTGYSFQNDGGYDTGMFSTSDGDVRLYSNNEEIVQFNTSSLSITKPFYLTGLNTGDTTKVLFYNNDTGEITQNDINAVISANNINAGGYKWEVDATTGALYSDQGVYIADQSSSVIIGQNVDLTNTNNNRVTIGNSAGQSNQQYGTVAIGENAGQYNQNFLSVAIGLNAGQSNQDHSSVAIGHGAGYNNQNSNATAIGNLAGKNGQSNYTVAIGDRAGYGNYDSQGYGGVAIGAEAAFYNQGQYAVAVGYQAGAENSGSGSVAIGDRAGQTGLSTDAIAIGTYAQENGSGWAPIAIGRYAGQSNQGSQSIALGSHAGNNGLGYHSVAIGHYAAVGGSGNQTVAIGDYAGAGYQHDGAVALGYYAGYSGSHYSVAIGYGAGLYDSTPLGEYQVAIGAYAAAGNGHDNSIVLNATGSYFDAVASGLFIKPVRYTEVQDAVDDGLMFYNQNTGELRYSYTLDGGSF